MGDELEPSEAELEAALSKAAGQAIVLAMERGVAPAWPVVHDAVEALGWRAIEYFMCAWPDALADEVFGGPVPDEVAGFLPVDSKTGEITGVQDLPPAERWAAQWVFARASMDEVAGSALWEVLPEDPLPSKELAMVLSIVALNLRKAARLGRVKS